eukprot:gnl/TRDRNA2_/TRDRNA2_176762_c0_seq6.p1 gnl/TRDRNA2_/TRDRNA2_176762_c0~~gnl/TRDRNA2_/TRDRNA2_176762_c0_seq6.p1  ORF type:complete len:376 (-),score=62.44 gnl/TRDRNA2_/TRDRNA2_176762_c0_seq6:145-1272(-)
MASGMNSTANPSLPMDPCADTNEAIIHLLSQRVVTMRNLLMENHRAHQHLVEEVATLRRELIASGIITDSRMESEEKVQNESMPSDILTLPKGAQAGACPSDAMPAGTQKEASSSSSGTTPADTVKSGTPPADAGRAEDSSCSQDLVSKIEEQQGKVNEMIKRMEKQLSMEDTKQQPSGLATLERDANSHEDAADFEVNPEHILAGLDARTTCMVRNIPSKYTERLLLKTFQQLGEGVKINFLYLPVNTPSGRNKGYCFVNFHTPNDVAMFYRAFHGSEWQKFNSEKICRVEYARIQGLSELHRNFVRRGGEGTIALSQQGVLDRSEAVFSQKGSQGQSSQAGRGQGQGQGRGQGQRGQMQMANPQLMSGQVMRL